MSTPNYRHTQIGWVILGSLAVALALLGVTLAAARMSIGAIVAATVLVATMALFGWLTVEVDGTQLRARFGVGLIGKRVALSDVRGYATVKNPWFWGWGIRRYPGGWLYNVSGSEAVELVLENGTRCRIGTDEPAALSRAIRDVVGDSGPISAAAPAAGARWRSQVGVVVASVAVLTVLGVALATVSMAARPTIAVTATTVSVKSGLYGVEAPWSDVTSVLLEPSLPRIVKRTNGYAGGGSLRGHFELEGLGNGQLFVEAQSPPFILVRTATNGFFFVNEGDPARTEELHRRILDAWTKTKGP